MVCPDYVLVGRFSGDHHWPDFEVTAEDEEALAGFR
jgi:hypothetical protein